MIVDPIERDEAVLTEREDEAAREERWQTFIAFLTQAANEIGWQQTAQHALFRYWRPGTGGSDISYEAQSFAETEGWHGVLSAIARAMKEQEGSGR